MKKIIFCFIFLFTIFNSQNLSATTLKDSVNHSERSEKNVLRDKFRNPLETLKFFEIEPSQGKVAPERWRSFCQTEIQLHLVSATPSVIILTCSS